MQERCAQALSWGMPYDMFWHGPLNAYFAYMRKAEIEAQQKADEQSNMAWLVGRYTIDAMAQVWPLFNMGAKKGSKGQPYPENPIHKKYKKEKRAKETGPTVNAHEMIKEHNEKLRLKRMERQLDQLAKG